jgi:hypothetical protein
MLSNLDVHNSSGGSSVFSIRSPRTAGRKPGGLRSLKIATLTALAAVAAGALAAPAGASLSAVGPVNPRTGFPDWYQDGTGLKLSLCLDGLPVCSSGAADIAPPDGEAFWWRAQGDLAQGTITAKMAFAQEAAWLNGGPISFGRIRVTITGARPGGVYSVRHPYGSMSITADASGVAKSTTDVGCGAPPCNWAAALGTGLGPALLHWDASAPAPPAGYIGDAATPHTVVGSPIGFNAFSVSGPGMAQSTNLLTVEGKLAGPPTPDFDVTGSGDFGTTTPGAPVQRTFTITSMGVPDALGRSNLGLAPAALAGPQAGAFSIVGDSCSGHVLPSGQACQVTVQLTPGAQGSYGATLGLATSAGGRVAAASLGGSVVTPAVAAASARSRLTIRKLRTTHRMSRARVLRRGIRLTMRVPAGAEIVKFSVMRVRNGKVNRKPVWLAYRVAPSRAGVWRVTLDSRALRRRLKAGLYQLNVTPGVSKKELGQTSTTRIRITRR